MKSLLIREFLKPMATRLGAVVAGYLVATLATDPAVANQIGVGLAAAAALAIDLVTRKLVEGR